MLLRVCVAVILALLLYEPTRAEDTRAQAAVTKPLPIEVAAGEKEFALYSNVRVSADGRYIAYAVRNERRTDVGLPMNAATSLSQSGVPLVFAYACDIYVTDTRTGKTQEITGERASNWDPAWSAQGDDLAFVSDRDGLARLWLWQAATGQMRRISTVPVMIANALAGVMWANSDTAILVETMPSGLTFATENEIISKGTHRDQKFVAASSAGVYDHIREPHGPSRETQRLQGYDGDGGPPKTSLSLVDVRTGTVQTLAPNFSGTIQGIDAGGRYLLYTKEVGVDPKNFDLPLIDISVLDLQSGKAKLRIPNVPASRYANVFWSPSNGKFAYFARRTGASGLALFLGDVATGAVSSLTGHMHSEEFGSGSAAWLPDGRSIIATVGNRMWLVDVDKRTVRSLSPAGVKTSAGNASVGVPYVITTRNGTEVWQPTGVRDAFYVQTWDPVTMHQRIDEINVATGTAHTVQHGNLQYNTQLYPPNFDASSGGETAAFVAWSAAIPPEVWGTTDGFRSIHRLTQLNAELDGYLLGTQKIISWMTTDGHRMQGTLLLPAGYVPGHRYPTVVWQRAAISGPQLLDSYGLLGPVITENWQLLATRGYAVFMPDFPTNKAADVDRLTKTDLMPALDKLVAMGVSDPNGFGITGESLGGEATMSIITLTNRFHAAVCTVGLDSELNGSMMFLPSGDAFRLQEVERWVGGTPWNNRAGYIASSPFFRLDRAHTPVLIVASRGDWTDTIPQYFTDEAFVGLRRLNQTDVEYALYSGGHGPFAFSYADRVDFWYRVIHWFDRYLKKGSHSSLITTGGLFR